MAESPAPDPDPRTCTFFEHPYKTGEHDIPIRRRDRLTVKECYDLGCIRNSSAMTLCHFQLSQPLQSIIDLVGDMYQFDSRSKSGLEAVWQSKAGAVTWTISPQRFFIQTPRDGVSLSLSFAADVNRCVIVSPDSLDTIAKHLEQWTIPGGIDGGLRSKALTVLGPLVILQNHVSDTTRTLAELLQMVGEVDEQIMDPSQDLANVIRHLHEYNTNLIKLDRRWHFEQMLSSSIQEVIEMYNSLASQNPKLKKLLEQLDDFLNLQKKLSQASEYDLSVLPRRIKNQFTAIYNLIAQRDTKATISIAEKSKKLAAASQRDSSSMKTIAGMTLIFLPPTFICSFFSMSFFNFEATGTKSLWVYVATAAPLTVVVILTWIAYNLWSTGREKSKLEDPENKLA